MADSNQGTEASTSGGEFDDITIEDVTFGNEGLESGESSEEEPEEEPEPKPGEKDDDPEPEPDNSEEPEEKPEDKPEEEGEPSNSEEPEPKEKPVETPEKPEEVDVAAEVSKSISQQTKGKYKSVEDMVKAINERPVLKDDFINKVVNYYNKNGTLTPFLEAASVDFSKMDSLAVLRHKFNKDKAGMEPTLRDKLFERDVLKRYNQHGDESIDESDVQLGRDEMNYEADQVRNQLIADQKEFLETPAEEAPEEEGPSHDEVVTSVKSAISPIVKEGKIEVKVGEESINIDQVDLDRIADIAADEDAIGRLFLGEDKKINWADLTEVMTFATNKEGFKKALLDSGKSLGRSEIEAELKNSGGQERSPSQHHRQRTEDGLDLNDAASRDEFIETLREQRS